MGNVDLELKLICGKGLKVSGLELKPYTIGEIVDYGYTDYMSSILLLTMTVDDFLKQFIESEIYYELRQNKHNFKPLDFYIMFGDEALQKMFIKSLSLILRIDKSLISIDKKNQNVVIDMSDEDKKLIDRDSYDLLVKNLKYQNHLESLSSDKNDEGNPEDERAKAVLDKLKKGREKVAQLKSNSKDDESLDLPDIISAVTTRSNSINKLNINDTVLYQLYDEFNRLQMIDAYETSIQASMMGADLKDGIPHWSKKI